MEDDEYEEESEAWTSNELWPGGDTSNELWPAGDETSNDGPWA